MAETAQNIREKLKEQEEAKKNLLKAIAAHEEVFGIPLGLIRVLRRNGKVINFIGQIR